MRLQFLGANRQVTGSRYFLEAGGLRLLIDCGQFQERPFLSRNCDPSPVEPRSIDCVLLTHAHLDHCGLLPKFVREGYTNRILCTAPTVDLARLVLLDAAKIQEEDAAYKRRRHEREHRKGPFPELPLSTTIDAQRALELFESIELERTILLNDHVSVRCLEAGHILGSAMIEVTVNENGLTRQILFSGDIGRWNKPLIHDPAIGHSANTVIMESTYGNRDHESNVSVIDRLADIVTSTAKRGGNIIIPTFAIDRAQELIFHFNTLVHEKKIPPLQVFVDSPMAVDATAVFKQHQQLLDDATQAVFRSGRDPFRFPNLALVQTVEQSRAINSVKMPCIIMAGSGMCTGGRIKHHLSQNISRPESTILFVGYQSSGTLGREIVDGKPEVRIHGRMHQVKARIERLDGMSAHADRSALLQWLDQFKSPPRQIFLTHGEESAALALAETLAQRGQWDVQAPEYLQTVTL